MNHSGARRTLAIGVTAAAICGGALTTVARPLHTAAATAGTQCSLWTDSSSDASVGGQGPQEDQLDIVGGAMSDDGTALTTTLTITNLSTTPAGGSANEYYVFWTYNSNTYFSNAEVAPSGTTYSYGTDNSTTGLSTLGTVSGTFNAGANGTITVTVPLSDVGSPPAGSAFSGVSGKSGVLEGAPGNPSGVSGGGILYADQDNATATYTLGQGCAAGATPTPTPTPTPAPCTGNLCFGNPVVLPQSGNTGSTSATCYNPCGEPSLVVSPVDGTLYVSTPRTILVCCNTQASPVWKSSDDGTSWSNPIFPSGAENATTGGDTELAVDKRGTVYEGELWLGSDSIYISPDKGSTWSWSPASHDVGADREWFVYSPQEDALYGWYDGFKGLMVVKAPLTTPLGSSAASFFPIERVVVPECAAGLATNCPDVVDSAAGIPILPGTTSPGRPTISPVDGTLYFTFPYQVAGQGVGIASTSDGGQTFSYNFVKGAGGGNFGDTGNDFPVSAVDSAGNLYVAWIENKGDGFNLYLAASKDKGATWTTPTEVSKGISATAVFPNVVAGAPGQVAVSWYGTSVKGDMNDANAMGSAEWNVYTSETINATAPQPSFSLGVVQSNFHKGVICTQGANCTGTTRELLDFFDMKIDGSGALLVVYTRDAPGGTGTEIAFAKQTGGCNLNVAGCGSPGTGVPEAPAAGALGGAGLAVAGLALVLGRRRKRRAMEGD